MARFFSELTFQPTIEELLPAGTKGSLIILTGGNNSGKSAYLKKTVDHTDKLYIGVNRFYSFHHLNFFNDNPSEQHNWFNNMQNTVRQEYQNFEQSYFDAANAITRLKNDRRKILFESFTEMFGVEIRVQPVDPLNEFSNRYVAVDGESLSITSSGTRLFLGILAALMDDRFTAVAIDEPELGLAPSLQRRLADVIIRDEHKAKLFPHNPNIILSTHSQLFLDKKRPSNNWVVSKNGDSITARQCSSLAELHDIQFRLLGYDLGELLLPHVVIFVEGVTDKQYIDTLLAIHVPKIKAAVQNCNSNIAERINYWASSLGDIQLSPYRERTLVIYDSVKQAGIEKALNNAGIPDKARIEWKGNGIEYLYPDALISEIFHKDGATARGLTIVGDNVSLENITYKKVDLCNQVCRRLTANTVLPKELTDKLITPLGLLVN